jgi:hypothetical protein
VLSKVGEYIDSSSYASCELSNGMNVLYTAATSVEP